MTYELVVHLARQALLTALLISAPLLTIALVVGLLVSVLQTVTQVQEQTVSFVLKLFAVGVTLFVLIPWTLSIAVGFASQIVLTIPTIG